VLTIATEFDFVPRLLAVLAAILPEATPGFDGAVARRMGAFCRTSHIHPRTGGLYACRLMVASSARDR